MSGGRAEGGEGELPLLLVAGRGCFLLLALLSALSRLSDVEIAEGCCCWGGGGGEEFSEENFLFSSASSLRFLTSRPVEEVEEENSPPEEVEEEWLSGEALDWIWCWSCSGFLAPPSHLERRSSRGMRGLFPLLADLLEGSSSASSSSSSSLGAVTLPEAE